MAQNEMLRFRLLQALARTRRQQRRLNDAFVAMQDAAAGAASGDAALADEVGDHGEFLIALAAMTFRWRDQAEAAGFDLPTMRTATMVRDLRNLIEHRDEWVSTEADDLVTQQWTRSRSGRSFSSYSDHVPLGHFWAWPDGKRLTHVGALPLLDLEADLDALDRAARLE